MKSIAVLPWVSLLLLSVPAMGQPRPSAESADHPVDGPIPYVIVTTAELRKEFLKLARDKSRSGTPAIVQTLSAIRSAYPIAADDAERVRLFLRDAHADWETRWVLLGGDVEVVPARRVLNHSPLGDRTFVSDYYFACLDGTWDGDGDGQYGENPSFNPTLPGDDPDLVPELHVGRAPVRTEAEARRFVAKTLDAASDPRRPRSHRHVIMAEDLGVLDLALHGEQLLALLDDDPAREIVRLYSTYSDSRWLPGALPLDRAGALDVLDEGCSVVLHVGGCGPVEIGAGYGPTISVADVLALENDPRLFHWVTFGSFCNAIDTPTSIGEALILAPDGGAVTVFAPTDYEFVSQAFPVIREYARQLYEIGVGSVGEAADAARLVTSPTPSFANVGYLLLGDPQLRPHAGVARQRKSVDVFRAQGSPTENDLTTVLQQPVSPRASTSVSSASGLAWAPPRPQPAASEARLELSVPAALAGTALRVEVYDAAGRRLRTLFRGTAAAPRLELRWDLRSDEGAAVHSGMYLAIARIGGDRRTCRLLVVR